MDFLRRRLRNQKLDRSELRKPADVVRWLGAVQAQEYPAATWAAGLRAKGITDAGASFAAASDGVEGDFPRWFLRNTV